MLMVHPSLLQPVPAAVAGKGLALFKRSRTEKETARVHPFEVLRVTAKEKEKIKAEGARVGDSTPEALHTDLARAKDHPTGALSAVKAVARLT